MNSYRKKYMKGYKKVGEMGNGELVFNENRVFVWDGEHFLHIHSCDGCIIL